MIVDLVGGQPAHQRLTDRGRSAPSPVAASNAPGRDTRDQRLQVPPVGPQQPGHPDRLEDQPVLGRVVRVPVRPHRVLLEQRRDGASRIRREQPVRTLARRRRPRSGRATRPGPVGLRSPADAVGRCEPRQGQGHDRAERMTSQHVHRPGYPGRAHREPGPRSSDRPARWRAGTPGRAGRPRAPATRGLADLVCTRHHVSWLDCTPCRSTNGPLLPHRNAALYSRELM